MKTQQQRAKRFPVLILTGQRKRKKPTREKERKELHQTTLKTDRRIFKTRNVVKPSGDIQTKTLLKMRIVHQEKNEQGWGGV